MGFEPRISCMWSQCANHSAHGCTASIDIVRSCKDTKSFQLVLDKLLRKMPIPFIIWLDLFLLVSLLLIWRHNIVGDFDECLGDFCKHEVPWDRVREEWTSLFPWNRKFWRFLRLICNQLINVNFCIISKAQLKMKKIMVCILLGSNLGPFAWQLCNYEVIQYQPFTTDSATATATS